MSPYKTTVITAADSQDLVAIGVVKTELGISGSDDDAYLARAITQASAAIASLCNRVFISETVKDTFRNDCGDSPEKLTLSRYPISSITTAVEAGTTLETDEYETDDNAGFIWRLNGDDDRLTWGSGKIEITYVAGYAAGSVPHDLQRAATMLVVQNYRAKGRDPLLKRAEAPGIFSEEYWVGSAGDNGALPPEVEALISVYRNPTVF
jgi:uncharacterized phiE125 gp8 family phage protein